MAGWKCKEDTRQVKLPSEGRTRDVLGVCNSSARKHGGGKYFALLQSLCN